VVTNLPAGTRGWRGKPAYIDAAHRVHARVEDAIRTGKDTGIGRFPSHEYSFNQARLIRGGRRRRWKIPANWPWAEAITRAWQRITALPDTT
jgi:hypothetical protein